MPDVNIDVLAKLNLQKQPFSHPVEVEELYCNTSLEMLFNGVISQLHTQNNIQVIKGEHGSGKSCFCHKLINENPNNLSITLHAFSRKHRSNHIFASLVPDGSASPDDNLQNIAVKAANAIFRQLRKQLQPVLIIDDAHLLNTKTLETLLKFANAIEKQGEGRLKILLIGERSIDGVLEKIDAGVLNKEEVHSTLLRPFTRQDVESYIGFRLQKAGYQGNSPLTKEQMDILQSRCGGLPSNIDKLSCDALNGRLTKSSLSFSTRNILIIVAVSACVVAPLLYFQFNNKKPEKTYPPIVEVTPSTETVETISETAPPGTEIAAEESDQQQIEQFEPYIETDINDTLSPNIEDHAETLLTQPVDEKPALTSTDESPEPRSEQWLLEQPGNQFVVQLIGASDKQKLIDFGEDLSIGDSVILIERTRNNQPWYVLLYGPFPTYDDALGAVSKLPSEIQNNNPWIRQIDALKTNPQ